MLKNYALDVTLSSSTRSQAIRLLANVFTISGKDPAVFEEVYKGEIFAKYLAPNSHSASKRNLLMWSYSLDPRPQTAAEIAASVTDSIMNGPDHDDTELVQVSQKLMKEADAGMPAVLQRDPNYISTISYSNYLLHHAYANVGIAYYTKDKSNSYRKEFDDLVEHLKKGSPAEQQYLTSTYLYYAAFAILIDNDTVTAKKQLDALASFVNSDPQFDTGNFVVWVRNAPQRKVGAYLDVTSSLFGQLENTSPDFKSLITKIQSSGQ